MTGIELLVGTFSPDGRPRVRPILGLWVNGTFRFVISRRQEGAKSCRRPEVLAGGQPHRSPVARLHLEGDPHELTGEVEVRRVVDA